MPVYFVNADDFRGKVLFFLDIRIGRKYNGDDETTPLKGVSDCAHTPDSACRT